MELKPCPFCGGEGRIEASPSSDGDGLWSYRVHCQPCGAESVWLKQPGKVRKAWNKRIVEDELREACQAAYNWINSFGEHAPIQFGGEAELAEQLYRVLQKAVTFCNRRAGEEAKRTSNGLDVVTIEVAYEPYIPFPPIRVWIAFPGKKPQLYRWWDDLRENPDL